MPIPKRALRSNDSSESKSSQKKQRVSKTTVDALQQLHHAIELSEKHCKKMPGIHHESVGVNVGHVLLDGYEDGDINDRMVFKHDRIYVERWEYGVGPGDFVCTSSKTLDQYAVEDRAKFAKCIPKLIAKAKVAENLVAVELNEISAEILASIEQSMEEGV